MSVRVLAPSAFACVISFPFACVAFRPPSLTMYGSSHPYNLRSLRPATRGLGDYTRRGEGPTFLARVRSRPALLGKDAARPAAFASQLCPMIW